MQVRPIIVEEEGGTLKAGFGKNVYVWARSESDAIEAAKAKILSDLARKLGFEPINAAGFECDAEDVAPSMAVWRTFLPQGFIFCSVEDGILD
jgi:hypothetical protein